MTRRRAVIDAATRAQALRLAAEVGPARAAEELGVNAGTLRSWQARASAESKVGEAKAATPDVADWRAGRERTAESAASIASEAIATARRELRAGRTIRAQQAMVSAGIAIDKLAQLEQQLTAAQDRQVRLDGVTAEMVVAVIDLFCRAIGVDQSPAAKRVLAGLLRQAGAGEILSRPEPASSEAYAAVRSQIGEELREKLEAELRTRFDLEPVPLELPPAGGTEVRELEELAEPRTIVRTAPEPVDAEVVEDEPERVPGEWLRAYHDDEPKARAAWQESQRQDARRERKEREKASEPDFFAGTPTSSRQDFSIDGPNSRMIYPGGRA
jgi:hypothetical protein